MNVKLNFQGRNKHVNTQRLLEQLHSSHYSIPLKNSIKCQNKCELKKSSELLKNLTEPYISTSKQVNSTVCKLHNLKTGKKAQNTILHPQCSGCKATEILIHYGRSIHSYDHFEKQLYLLVMMIRCKTYYWSVPFPATYTPQRSYPTHAPGDGQRRSAQCSIVCCRDNQKQPNMHREENGQINHGTFTP